MTVFQREKLSLNSVISSTYAIIMQLLSAVTIYKRIQITQHDIVEVSFSNLEFFSMSI